MRGLLAALLLAAAYVTSAPAQVLPPARLELGRQAMNSIYDLDYAGAERICQRLIQTDRGDPLGYALLARNMWAMQLDAGQGLTIDRFSGSAFYTGGQEQTIMVSAEAEQRFRDTAQSAVTFARARLNRNPGDLGAMFSLGLALQTRASYEFTMKASWWPAFRDGESALKLHRSVSLAAPDFVDARLAQGASYYAVASVPWTIRWLPFVLGYRGSKESGKRELDLVASRGVILADDARSILVLLNCQDLEYDHAAHELEELGRKHPRNYLIPLELAAVALRQNQSQKAIAIYKSVLAKVQGKVNGYAALHSSHVYLRLGVAARAGGDLQASVEWLVQALNGTGGNLKVQVAARLELGKTRDLRGERKLAMEQYRVVAEAEDFLGSRREAQSLMSRPFQFVR
ncbi:MAG TPA: hypothetical protein VGK29_16580 [Paludibaculum sp.]|jgi:hypothetical protein